MELWRHCKVKKKNSKSTVPDTDEDVRFVEVSFLISILMSSFLQNVLTEEKLKED
jgi:hypothetical protein